jgi:hypothetical protein
MAENQNQIEFVVAQRKEAGPRRSTRDGSQ